MRYYLLTPATALNLFKAYPSKLLRTSQQPIMLFGEKICLRPYEPLVLCALL